MIGKKFTNNLESSRSLFDDPYEWGIARNLAYASIRDEIEAIIKQTNENSADVFINAQTLHQNLKNKTLNQYIESKNVVQEVNLMNDGQLNQIFMNSNIYQTINYIKKEKIVKETKIINSTLASLFFNNSYGVIIYDIELDKTINMSFNNILEMGEYIYNNYKKAVGNDIIVFNNEKKANKNGYKYGITSNKTHPIFASKLSYLTYDINKNETLNDDGTPKYVIFIVNMDKFKLQNQTEKRTIEKNLFGQLLSNKNDLGNIVPFYQQTGQYEKYIEPLIKTIKKTGGNYNKLFN